MSSVLATLAPLAVIGLLFALDPGGAIAESGFPDFQAMDWKQLTAWGFRTIGVGVALLLILVLWLWPKYKPPEETETSWGSSYPPTPQSSSMPAAAVSVLVGRMIWGPTLLASIIEMCQRGTLRIEAVNTSGGFLYQLSRQYPARYDWERVICNILPSGPTTVQALHDRLNEHEVDIGDSLGEYLHQQGLYDVNPVRVRRDNLGDAIEWVMLAGALMGIGSGLWLALWLSQWWANALVGAFVGFVYILVAPSVPTGMAPPTQRGAHEISQWLGWKKSLTGSGSPVPSDQRDSMMAYVVGLNLAQPWLDLSVSAPPWFGSGQAYSLGSPDQDAAYHGFMHSVGWKLDGRSEAAAKAAAAPDYATEAEKLLSETLHTSEAEETAKREGGVGTAYERPQTAGVKHEAPAREQRVADAPVSRLDYRTYRPPGQVEEPSKGRRGCRGCLLWGIGVLSVGALVVMVLVGINLASPAVKPCPSNSPTIPPPGLLGAAVFAFEDECTSVIGEVVSVDAGELVVKVDRGEYVQWVGVIGPAEVLEQVPVGRRVHVAGRIREHEERGYAVHYGVDRGWWGNFRDNFPEGFLAP